MISRSSAIWARWSHSSIAATSASRTVGAVVAGAQRALELGLDHRHGRAQLVAGVGDELALAVEGPPQAIEHVVERLAEPADLVVSGGQRQPLAVVRQRDLGRPPAHRLHGARARPWPRRSPAPTSGRWPGRRRRRRRSPARESATLRSSSDWPTTTTEAADRRGSGRARTRVVPSIPAIWRSSISGPRIARRTSAGLSTCACRPGVASSTRPPGPAPR